MPRAVSFTAAVSAANTVPLPCDSAATLLPVTTSFEASFSALLTSRCSTTCATSFSPPVVPIASTEPLKCQLLSSCVCFYCYFKFNIFSLSEEKPPSPLPPLSTNEQTLPTPPLDLVVKNPLIQAAVEADRMARDGTPERVEFENSMTIEAAEDEQLSEIDEDEWTDHNFGSVYCRHILLSLF